jgi:hypothetical protein
MTHRSTDDKFYGVVSIIEKTYPNTCFTITRDIDDRVVVYTHTRVENILKQPGILPCETSLSQLHVLHEMSNVLYKRLFQVPIEKFTQMKIGRYEVSIGAFTDRKITLSLLKNGKVKAFIPLGTHYDVHLRNIHLTVNMNALGIPIGVKRADVYGLTKNGERIHEEIEITAETEAIARSFLA